MKANEMKANEMKAIILRFSLLVFTASFGLGGKLYAQCGSTGCNSNTFLTVTDPNTMVYDNIVSTFHSSIARKEDGTVWGWGEQMAPTGGGSQLSPVRITPANGYNYTGNILLFSGGSVSINQSAFSLLTTTGLYAWGDVDIVYNSGVRPSGVNFGLIDPTNDDDGDGLPPGVDPAEVKMMFSTTQAVVLTTCSGHVWILTTGYGYALGTNVNSIGATTVQRTQWHQVQQSAVSSGNPLTNVVAVRGCDNAFVALKSDGTLWTWGYNTYLGNGTPLASRPYAQQMPNLPVTPKMIGMTMNSQSTSNGHTYYLLGTNGNLYSLGDNFSRQLGDFTTTVRTSWVQVKKSSAANDFLTNVAWISPQEHDNQYGAINVLTADGKLWTWGRNDNDMQTDGAAGVAINPTNPPTGISGTDVIGAVETGGHTSVVIKQCEKNFGYIGHRINGSMGNGDATNQFESQYNFETVEMPLCSSGQPHIDTPDSTFVCNGSTLTPGSPVNPNNVFSIYSGNATVTSAGVLTLTGPGPIRVLYGAPGCEAPDTVTLQQRDMGNLNPAIYPVASATITAANSAWLGTAFPTTDCATATTDPADGLTITGATGAGTQASPWAVNFPQTYSFNLTVNGNGTAKPVYWAVWYDVNGDGDFTDADDYFNTGNTIHGSPVTAPPFNVAVPASAGNTGAIRIASSAIDPGFTKAMNGQVTLTNGEIEDFFLTQTALQPISGTVLNDNNGQTGGVNGTPVAGVTVTLYAADGVTVIATTTTDAGGNYSFPGVAPGNYVVGITPPGGFSNVSSSDGITPANGLTSVIVGNAPVTGVSFGVNQPPVVGNDSATGQVPGTTATVPNILANDSDPNGGTLSPDSISLVFPAGATNPVVDAQGDTIDFTVPGQGTWTLNPNGSVSFTPQAGFAGDPAPINYTITDAAGLKSNIGTIVIDYDYPPVAVNDTASTPMNTPLNSTVTNNDTCRDGPCNYTPLSSDPPVNGTVTLHPDGTYTYTPNTGFTGTDTFSYVICNSGVPVRCDTASVFITVLSVLPADLLSFKADIGAPCDVQLSWTTGVETNLHAFEIESGIDGAVFRKAGSVAAHGFGSSYTYRYSQGAEGRNYFRLKMIDLNGSYAYSRVAMIDLSCTGTRDIRVYPAVVKGQLTIDGLQRGESVSVYDMNGRRALLAKADGPQAVLDLSPLSQGSYVVVVVTLTGEPVHYKIMKQ